MLKQASEKRARFVITEAGKPLAVLLSVADFDDMLEELDPGFQRSLRSAGQECRAGRSVALREYAKGALRGGGSEDED